MGKFLNGLLIGIGIGLFIAPQTGEETRRMIRERLAALRKSMSSEGDRIDIAYSPYEFHAHSPELTTVPVRQAEPIATLSSERQVPVTPPSAPPAQPIAPSFIELREDGSLSASPAQPVAATSNEPQEHGTISVPAAEVPSTLSNQNASTTDTNRNIADTEQMSGLTTNPDSLADAHLDEQTPLETTRPDTATTDKLPPLPSSSSSSTSSSSSSSSNMPSRASRRKASTRTPNTGKTKGYNRS